MNKLEESGITPNIKPPAYPLTVNKETRTMDKIVSTKHPDLLEWEKDHKCQLFIGSKIAIKSTAEYYEERYDKGKVYMIVNMYVDSGGLNLGINSGETDDRYICETDGYYIDDIEPA